MAGTRAPAPRIAIVGGGIGGLAAAAFLHRAGLHSAVYEQAPQLKEVGAGLVVAPNAARLLRRLGVLEEFASRAVQLDVGWQFRRWQDGTVLSSEDLSSACERLYGEHTYTAHRADLLEVIQSVVPEDNIHLGKRCVEIVMSGTRPTLRFGDGEVVEADVVIGADGVHSVVRNALAESSPAAYSGICAFRALVPADRAPSFARQHAQTLWIGPGHHLVHYPVSAGKLINLVAFAPAGDYSVESWSATATIEEFLAEFEGWDHRLADLIGAAGTPGRWALLDRAPLRRWSSGRVTLLGDAAHPMFPFFAQGAAQAVEDAAVLVCCLTGDLGDPARALRRYETLRIPRTGRLQRLSHARSLTNHLPDGPQQKARDLSFADTDPLVANGWIYEYDPDAAGCRPGRRRSQHEGDKPMTADETARRGAILPEQEASEITNGAVSAEQQQREQAVAEQAVASFEHAGDPRLRYLMQALTQHVHAFLREVRLTEAEWRAAIGFLTAAGHITDERRQEFILLSDVFGASMQTIAINNEAYANATEATVLGPFFVEGSPEIPLGGDISGGAAGEPCWVTGAVTDTDGKPVPGALVEVWQADADGYYDVQYPDDRVAARGHLIADDNGSYRFWALTPTPYPIPDDGPVGRLLAEVGRSPMRASHLHFMVSAPGLRTLVTHIFVRGDELLGSDAVFGVKESLVKDFVPHPAGAPAPDSRDLGGRAWSSVRFDIVLAPAGPRN